MKRGGWGSGPRAGALAGAALLWCTACQPSLPEPESPGALMYAQRCNNCHRLYAPASMKYEMWKTQVERMQGEMVRRGVEPLNQHELSVVLDYLQRHSG